MSKLRVQCSPLTGNIYAGRLNTSGSAWAGQKHDVTSDVIGAIIEKVGAGNALTVSGNLGQKYEITVKVVAP